MPLPSSWRLRVTRWRTCADPAVQDEDITGVFKVDAISVRTIPGCRDKQSSGVHAVAVRKCKMELRAVSNSQIAYAHIDTILKDQPLICQLQHNSEFYSISNQFIVHLIIDVIEDDQSHSVVTHIIACESKLLIHQQ